jgi:hypothetical protein
MPETPNETLHVDAAIIGGGFGAVAAALALTDRGHRVAITDEFAWIGGQVTSQALCVLDELYDPTGETIMNARYAEFRERLRDHYRTKYKLSPLGAQQVHLCAGNAACTPVTAEPYVAHAVLLDMLTDALAKGLLIILPRHVPVSAQRAGDRAESVTCSSLDRPGQTVTIHAKFFLDGSETGATYPLLKLPYRLGSEAQSETGEKSAEAVADRSTVQSFTYCFVVEFVPGGNFTGPVPPDYERLRDSQPFKLFNPGAKFFKLEFDAQGFRIVPFWYYRSLVDHRNFDDPAMPYDRAVINVPSNDYHDENFIENPRAEEILEEARKLSRAYLHWLQTEAPRDDGGKGYPELRPVPEATGTPDGLAQGPYIREGRRLKACQTVVEGDLATHTQTGARARFFPNSVGLAAYFIDQHTRSGHKRGRCHMARPYSIPLGALVSPELRNFAVAAKGIGVTQIANGAYRLHTPEWAIGEAAGELAAFCLERQVAHPNLEGAELLEFQRRLLKQGIPLYWYEDVPPEHPSFAAAQLLALTGIWPGHPEHLRFDPHQSICRHRPMFLKVCERLKGEGADLTPLRDIHVIAHGSRKHDVVHQIVAELDRKGWPKSAINRQFPPPAPGDDTPLDPAFLW